MQTAFTLARLADPDIAAANDILRACVHCGFCNATCPTYVLLGDELDGPRGRIYQIKSFLEDDRAPTAEEVRHVDRCLSCLACMTTCPASVNYMHLVDHGRAHIEATFRRPAGQRLLRALLAAVLPRPGRFRAALRLAAFGRLIRPILPRTFREMLALAPTRQSRAAHAAPPSPVTGGPQVIPAEGARKKRVALLAGCVQQALAPQINAATARLLARHGCEVVIAAGAGCCGSLVHHLGRRGQAEAAARANIDAWHEELGGAGLDAVVSNTSGCGTMVKDYGFMLRADPEYSERAARISSITRDVSELIGELGFAARDGAARRTTEALRVTYQSACSLQHGQQVDALPARLLEQAGFAVCTPAEAHLCCGSAGTFNFLQPDLATALRDRKLGNIAATAPDVIATGNIGCMMQLGRHAPAPVVHTAELLDWATGGPKPPAMLASQEQRER